MVALCGPHSMPRLMPLLTIVLSEATQALPSRLFHLHSALRAATT